MDFMDFLIGDIDLIVNKNDLDRLLSTLYDKWYKKDRLFHVTSNRSDYPHLKTTEDTCSCKFFFFNDDGKEYRLHLDGSFDKDTQQVHLTSISPSEYFEIDTEDYLCIQKHLLKLTSLSEGKGIYISKNGYPLRLYKGGLENSRKLLEMLYDKIPDSDRKDIQSTFDWISFTLGRG